MQYWFIQQHVDNFIPLKTDVWLNVHWGCIIPVSNLSWNSSPALYFAYFMEFQSQAWFVHGIHGLEDYGKDLKKDPRAIDFWVDSSSLPLGTWDVKTKTKLFETSWNKTQAIGWKGSSRRQKLKGLHAKMVVWCWHWMKGMGIFSNLRDILFYWS